LVFAYTFVNKALSPAGQLFQVVSDLSNHDDMKGMPNSHQFEDMVMMANDGIMVIQDDKLTIANPAFHRMLGFDDGELVGNPISSILDVATAHYFTEGQEALHWSALNQPMFRACLMTKKGSLLDVEISISNIIISDLPASLNIVRDITHQIELEAAIDASENRYRALFDSSPIAYITLSLHGNILQVNKAACRLLGYKEDQLLRRNLASFIPSDDRRDIVNEVVSEVAQGKSLENFEMQLQCSDGKLTWVSMTANLLEYSDKSSNIGIMALDIDRRKMAEVRETAERERANLYLEVMTHDLNNINQSLLFSLGLVENSMQIPEDARTLMQQSNWQIRRAARMTANMRALLRLQESPPAIEEVDLFDYIQIAKYAVEEDFPWKKLSLKTNVTKGEFKVAGHEYLHQVCFNIIHNAATFDDSANVEVEVIAEQVDSLRMVRLEFTDHGQGVPDTAKEFIFRRTGSPNEQIVGRGLGLTLVDQIVRSLGGKIRVEDRVPGDHIKGSKFIIMLPKWVEAKELPCGRHTCITFYKSNHCVFCDPAMETLLNVLNELGVPKSIVEEFNVDNPSAGVNRDELPMLPFIKICETELTGFISDEAIRSAVLNLAVKNCYPDFH
jgi:PAS domain S-box-containing protein